MSSTLKAIRNLWPKKTQEQQQRPQRHGEPTPWPLTQRETTAQCVPSNHMASSSPSPSSSSSSSSLSPSSSSSSSQQPKLARARAAVQDGSHGYLQRKKARAPQGFTETRVWMLSRRLSTRRRAEDELRLRRDEAESRLLSERSWGTSGLVNFSLPSRLWLGAVAVRVNAAAGRVHSGQNNGDGDGAPVADGDISGTLSFQVCKDGEGMRLAAAVVDWAGLCQTLLLPPEDDNDEVERLLLIQGRNARRNKHPRLFKTLPPPPSARPSKLSKVVLAPAHLDAIVPSTAIHHLAAYLSLPASLGPRDVVEHVLTRPNLRMAVARLRAADADLFNSMPWAKIVSGVCDDSDDADDRTDIAIAGDAVVDSQTTSPETQHAWARLHTRNAANKHRCRREADAASIDSEEDLFPVERRRDRKRRLAVHNKAWQRGSPHVTGPPALYRVHDNVGGTFSAGLGQNVTPGRGELVDAVLSWVRPGRSKLCNLVIVDHGTDGKF